MKILHANSEEQRQRLLAAYRAACPLQALNHRHIVAVEDVIHINGHFGLVSEYVDGLDLQDWLDILTETGVSVPKRVICEIVRGIAVGLDTAQNRVPQQQHHPLRLSHNDLKPTNIVVDRDGELKIVDFQTGFTSISGEPHVQVRCKKVLSGTWHRAPGWKRTRRTRRCVCAWNHGH